VSSRYIPFFVNPPQLHFIGFAVIVQLCSKKTAVATEARRLFPSTVAQNNSGGRKSNCAERSLQAKAIRLRFPASPCEEGAYRAAKRKSAKLFFSRIIRSVDELDSNWAHSLPLYYRFFVARPYIMGRLRCMDPNRAGFEHLAPLFVLFTHSDS
jgi:hypothetical protein